MKEQTQTPPAMDWHNTAEQYAPGALGSLAYFLYMRIYRRLDWRRSLVALVTGVLVSAYVGPQVAAWLPAMRHETVGFIVGFLGMKLAEAFVSVDMKAAVREWVEKKGGEK